jgi:RNA polymerase primary sigma factor
MHIDELVKQAQIGDESAREQVILQSLSNVEKISGYVSQWGQALERQDLYQEGVIGVMRAIDKYDSSLGVPFDYYSKKWIKAMMTNAIYTNGRSIRTPVVKAHLISKLEKIKEKLFSVYNREPTYQEIAEVADISVEKVKKALLNNISTHSMYSESVNENGDHLYECFEDTNIYNQPDNSFMFNEEVELIKMYMPIILSEKEQFIIDKLFGLTEDEKWTLEKIAEELKIPKSTVYFTSKKALEKLKEQLEMEN